MSKILHINSEYSNRPLYRNLVKHLDAKGFEQHIYVPVRSASDIGKNQAERTNKTTFTYAFILNPALRFLYFRKTQKIYRDICKTINVQNIELIHAHTLFTNGGPAYRLKKRFGIPYIVAIRNTDLTIFYKYFPHIRNFGLKVLKNASAIILMTPAWKEKLKEIIPEEDWPGVDQKCRIIPNAVDEYWLKNRPERILKAKADKVEILYAGRFIKKKGLQYLINALDMLNEDKDKFRLTLIGGGGNYDKEIRSMAADKDFVRIKEQMPKEKLIEEYQKADVFAMPSHSETFGLVYIEAMSQGLPVLYAKNEGIDKLFEDFTVGTAAEHDNPEDIAAKLIHIEQNKERLAKNAVNQSTKFSWKKISEQYADVYLTIIENQKDA
ncbi:MAG: glycosyltransferase family 4 protein [Bacteroidales bacterium]|nr:glycosyltransferase family 4 protein [Bacteroidales bacterium]